MLKDKRSMQTLAPLCKPKALPDIELFAANFIAQLRSTTAGSSLQTLARVTKAPTQCSLRNPWSATHWSVEKQGA
ncbi:hypothetical protein GGD63_003528 [Bradyrhizobium sp. cir1]|uniref:hypothetical protein n=1 Tax=Bradyrhizobium sp. cir1 TaxID=1445730 RepID=UPI001605850C|nr:hypothetical protein [Bradyrhizobium sp. cir1]MBB4370733.1 hypothetical protein [Bradyrhizobium sp. cir1]